MLPRHTHTHAHSHTHTRQQTLPNGAAAAAALSTNTVALIATTATVALLVVHTIHIGLHIERALLQNKSTYLQRQFARNTVQWPNSYASYQKQAF